MMTRRRDRCASSSRIRRLSRSATNMLPWESMATCGVKPSDDRREPLNWRSTSPPVLTSTTSLWCTRCFCNSCLLKRLTINVPVGDSTAWSGSMSSGSWTRLSSSPSESNSISWWVRSVVTSKRVDVTDSVHGSNVSSGNFGSQRFMSSPSNDTRQTHFSQSATYSWDVRSQATMSNGRLKSLTTMSVSRWCVVALNLKIVEDRRQTM